MTESSDWLARIRSWTAANELELGPDEFEAIERFEEDLYAANEVMNLTRVPRPDFWRRHFVDSLLFHDLIPQEASVLDIGTGPGFPAWPISLARPDTAVTGLDSNGKMVGFLRKHPLPNLEVTQARAEDWDRKEKFEVVTGRALAPLAIQLELSAPFCRLGGWVIPMRSVGDDVAEVDLRPMGLKLIDLPKRRVDDSDTMRLFPVYLKERPSDVRLPRRWSEIRARPLLRV
jgi:16S rRNA (guanine527-N7)-methyltransferase